MFPIPEMIMDAEIAYRREQMLAVRPRRSGRRRRHARRRERTRTQAQPGHGLRAA